MKPIYCIFIHYIASGRFFEIFCKYHKEKSHSFEWLKISVRLRPAQEKVLQHARLDRGSHTNLARGWQVIHKQYLANVIRLEGNQ